MKLSKVHRILKFKQSGWLKKFVKPVELINNPKDYVKCVSRPSFVSQKIFSKNFVAVHKIKPVLTLNKPIYVRFSILELNTSLRYEFHYKYIKNKFDAKLLFSNTGSLVYEIKTEDVYEDFYLVKDLFDLSDHPLQSLLIQLIKKLLAK